MKKKKISEFHSVFLLKRIYFVQLKKNICTESEDLSSVGTETVFASWILVTFQEFTPTSDLHEIAHKPHVGCCLPKMFTEVIVIFWFSRIAVLKNFNVCCSCGNLYNNTVTCNIKLYMFNFTRAGVLEDITAK